MVTSISSHADDYRSYSLHRHSDTSSMRCLATMIYHEARGTDRLTKIKTVNVVLNRVRNHKYPSTVCGVIYQKTRYKHKVVCQFSWSCKKHIRIVDKKAYKQSMEVAEDVVTHPENQKFRHILHFRNRGHKLIFKP